MRQAICLLSGGLDSTTCLYLALREDCVPLCLTVNYGQLHARELDAAREIALRVGAEQRIVKIELPWLGSALLDANIPLPEGRSAQEMAQGIPSTYVPARNTILLSLALSWAEAASADAIYIGANAIDYSGYPDCRPQFFQAFERVCREGTKAGVEAKHIEIRTPLTRFTKADIIRLGTSLGVPYELTWTCYQGSAAPCGRCDACVLRHKGFDEAGIPDPLLEKMRKVQR